MKKRVGLRQRQLFVPVLITSLLLCGLMLLVNMAAAGNSEMGGGTNIVTSLIRVSVNENGEEGNGRSDFPAISAAGRFIAFQSLADNLVMSDTNGFLGWDIFVFDLETDSIEMVSINSDGVQGNGPSTTPDISSDGRFVVFSSNATNLVMSDTNGVQDVFVHDRQTGMTKRASVNTDGEQANGSSSSFPEISADGRFVTFSSSANNLVTDDTNNWTDVFIHDLQTGVTERVSINSQGVEGSANSASPSISGDGRFVSFSSSANNLVPNDTNATNDIFVHDRQTGQTTRVSISSTGQEANGISLLPDISDDGRYVVFSSRATNLVPGVIATGQDYLHDRQTGMTILASADSTGQSGADLSGVSAISPDGRYVTFGSIAPNLVPGDTNGEGDIFVYDQVLEFIFRVNITPNGTEGNDLSWAPTIAKGGQIVAFWSRANNLVVGDNNGKEDVFVSQWQLFEAYLPITAR